MGGSPPHASDDATIAAEAYVYLYPLVLMELTRRQMTNIPAGTRPGFGPMGTFVHVRQFPPADFKAVVRPNFDTLYSIAWLDVSAEPAIVSMPDTDGRYYLLPVLDMWTDVFAVPGSRTSGTGAGEFALVPRGWSGDLPAGVEAIEAPTPHVWIIGRTQTNGPKDYAAVHAVQDGYRVVPLSGYGSTPPEPTAPQDPSVDMATPPDEQVLHMPARDFFTLAARLLAFHGAHATDWSVLARARRVGLHAGEEFDYDAQSPEVRAALDAAPQAAAAHMRESVPLLARVVNGWQMNTDTMGVYGNHYVKRAAVAHLGLGANPAEDAVYPLNLADADGAPLDGDNDYVLHFAADELPPVGAFWSVTMYDADGFQSANELDRFAIGDRDDLVYNADGSLDILIQHEDPGAERVANWLPAPRGRLGVTMRLYEPAPHVLIGGWNPPPIRRVTG